MLELIRPDYITLVSLAGVVVAASGAIYAVLRFIGALEKDPYDD